MELSTGRLEGAARIQERPFSKSSDEPKQRAPRRPKSEAEPETEPADEQESHQLDDIA
jgi:hypothetical protein